jgi:hypothetical protein
MPEFKWSLAKIFDGFLNKTQPPEIIKQRTDRAAQSLLENERLTADLNDEAANELLNWAIACARMIAKDTVNLNDQEAEAVMSPRLRAMQRLMRGVNQWITRQQEQDVEGSANALNTILEQATVVYGYTFAPLELNAAQNFSGQQVEENPQQMIANLHTFIEQSISTQTGK